MFSSSTGYYIYWNLKWIHVFRPDVECTNGIIHVIDKPFFEQGDMYVPGNTATKMIIDKALAILLIAIYLVM